MLFSDFKIWVLFTDSLLPIVSTDCAAANDAINNDYALIKGYFTILGRSIIQFSNSGK